MPEPLEQQLVWDISGPLASIDTLDSALSAVVADFAAGLSAAVESVAALTVDVDTSTLTSSVETALLDAADEPIVIEADTLDAENAIAELDGESVEVTLEVDDSALVGATEGLDDEEITVPVGADVSSAEEAIASIEGDEVIIQIDADLGDVDESIAAVDGAAGRATSSMGDLTAATGGFAAAAAVGQGDAAGLDQAVGLLGGTAGQVGGALLAGGAALAFFFTQAVSAEAATKRFDEAFGPLAARVNDLDVGNLNADLSELALRLGSDDDALRNIATTLFQFQVGAGTSRVEAAQFSETVLALSARAVALNPALGRVEDVAGRLGNVLGRGGRFASAFGLSLSSADIKARAADNALKGLGDGVSFASLQLAGGQLALEQYGDHLDQDIAKGSENPIIKLRALRQTFEEAAEEIGKPLIAPIFAVLTDVLPVAIEVAEVLGKLGEVVLPVLGAAAPLLTPLAAVLGLVADGLDVLADLPTPVIVGIGAIALAATLAIAPVDTLFVSLAALGSVMAVVTGPIGITIAALAALGIAANIFGANAEETSVNTDALAEALSNLSAVADGGTSLLASSAAALKAYVDEALRAKDINPDVAGGFRELGITSADVAKALALGPEQFLNWIEGVENSAVATGGWSKELSAASRFLSEQFNATQNLAHAQLNQLVSTGQITEAQRENAIATTSSADSADNFTAALARGQQIARANAEAQLQNALSAGELQRAFAALVPAIASGAITSEDAQQVADQLGISLEDAEAAVKSLSSAMDSFVSTGLGALPDAGAALDTFANEIASAQQKVIDSTGKTAEEVRQAQDELIEALDPQRLIDAQAKQNFQILAFQQNLGILLARGRDDAVAQLVAEGPVKGGEVAAALVNDDAAAKAYEGGLELGTQLTGGYTQFLEENAPELAGKTVTLANGQIISLTDAIRAGVPAVGEASAELSTAAAEQFEPDLPGRVDVATQAAAVALQSDDSIGQAAGEKGLAALAAFEAAYGPAGSELAVQIALQAAHDAIEADPTLAAASTAKGEETGGAFDPKLKPGAEAALDEARSFFESFTDLDDVATTLGVNIGTLFAVGVADGITSGRFLVQIAGAGLAAAAEQAAKDRLGIKSPSTVGIAIGQDLVRGVVVGLGDTGIITVAGTAVGTAIATAGTAAISSVISGFNDPATTSSATETLKRLIAQAQADSTSSTATSTAQSEFDSFVSSVISQLPDAGSTISAFSSELNAALTANQRQFAEYRKSVDAMQDDAVKVVKLTDETGIAFGVLASRQAAYNRVLEQTPKKASDAQKAALKEVKDALQDAQREFDRSARELESANSRAERSAAKFREESQQSKQSNTRLDRAEDPASFTRALNQQLREEQAFRENIRKIVGFGDTDLAEELARAGEDAAGKIAAGFASSRSKAKAAEAAIDHAAAFTDSYEQFLEEQFAPKIQATTDAATKQAVAAVTGAGSPQITTSPSSRVTVNAVSQPLVGPAAASSIDLDLTIALPDGTFLKPTQPIIVTATPTSKTRMKSTVVAKVNA